MFEYSLPIALGIFCISFVLLLALRPKKSPPAEERLIYPSPQYGTSPYRERINPAERPVSKRRELNAPYTPSPLPAIALTPRQLERMNFARKQRGRPALNREGIKNAIAHPFDRWDVQQPRSSSDWLTYLILYEVFVASHTQSHCSGTGGFTIDPSAPYNGQGGEYGGAGASGDWSSPTAMATTGQIAAAIAVGASPEYLARQADAVVDTYQRSEAAFDMPDPLSDPNSYKGGYPDPTPTPDSSSSSSSDSGSSGSGDSGGGGGGD